MTTLLFPLLVTGASLLLLAQPTTADSCIGTTRGVGYTGFDLAGAAVNVASPWLCRQECAGWNTDLTKSGLPPCTLWSFYTGVINTGGFNCWLKTNTTQVPPTTCPSNNPFCAVSGTIDTIVGPGMLGGVGYNGFDLPGSAVIVASPWSCGQKCIDWNNDPSPHGPCTLWSYYTGLQPGDNNCYLKTNTTQVPPNTCPTNNPFCAVSGTMDAITGWVSGVGYNGFDLPSSAVQVSSPWLCSEQCVAWNRDSHRSAFCTLWSFYNGGTGLNCFLKTNTTQVDPTLCPPSNPICAISGSRNPQLVEPGMLGGVGYNGFDIPNSAMEVSSPWLCGQQCAGWNSDPTTAGFPRCTLWSYYIGKAAGEQNCFLKTNTTQVDPAPCPSSNPMCAVSGTIRTTVAALAQSLDTTETTAAAGRSTPILALKRRNQTNNKQVETTTTTTTSFDVQQHQADIVQP